jgi:hypothetical protein
MGNFDNIKWVEEELINYASNKIMWEFYEEVAAEALCNCNIFILKWSLNKCKNLDYGFC